MINAFTEEMSFYYVILSIRFLHVFDAYKWIYPHTFCIDMYRLKTWSIGSLRHYVIDVDIQDIIFFYLFSSGRRLVICIATEINCATVMYNYADFINF
jgi:hypothetical protein